MKKAQFTVTGNSCYYEIVEMLELELKKNYAPAIIDGRLFFEEDYSLMTNSNLLIVTRVQMVNGDPSHCDIEVVSGGGGEGVFSLRFGNEKRRVNRVAGLITALCERKQFRIHYQE